MEAQGNQNIGLIGGAWCSVQPYPGRAVTVGVAGVGVEAGDRAAGADEARRHAGEVPEDQQESCPVLGSTGSHRQITARVSVGVDVSLVQMRVHT